MKNKVILIVLIIFALFTITGCETKKENAIENTPDFNNTSNEIKEDKKSLVLYFSATGTTKSIAQRIANESNSEIVEIMPKEKYTSEDLNYNSDCRANREQRDSSSRPQIENSIDITKYDTIYLGYPLWWGTNPKIILTLLDTYDFTGKTIIPFCTSGSSGISGSVNDLRNYNSSLNIKDGKRFSTSDSDEVIKEFIKSNK